jgi:hypothetical protein
MATFSEIENNHVFSREYSRGYVEVFVKLSESSSILIEKYNGHGWINVLHSSSYNLVEIFSLNPPLLGDCVDHGLANQEILDRI